MQPNHELLEGERKAQGLLDNVYENLGMEVVNRRGNHFRDVVLRWRGKEAKVEEKIRDGEWDDIAIEMMDGIGEEFIFPDRERCSQCGKGERHDGWPFYTQPDWLHYVTCAVPGTWEPTRIIRFDWDPFKRWFFSDYLYNGRRGRRGEYATSGKGNKGVSLNLLLPIQEIPPELMGIYRVTREDLLEPIPF